MEKIITAQFENVDFAEAAARNLRSRVEGVRQIVIRTEPDARVSQEAVSLPFLSLEAATAVASNTWAFGSQTPVSPVIVQDSGNSLDSSQATLEVRVSQESERTVPRAVNCLFNSGGFDVNIQN